ncbi:5-carboxymethyl-2-hydroxymuconate isomerase [Xinfangfangia sp. CPCC 101601]|uniref:5-carboxymethyl-2-hydroxymuconate isomerase n=1 Tax=Pseudogemmobacter lacusdianii TaxID=3069608 RepID=A0ABU0W1K1_9RHOB|nr:5-carboxymethyl-2-hydroxymuconate isomerase [Xinfangfangia sp. CPCC 101601]MDQ2067648.1 5-carboxymethyl-2-hydroxymuconate isomerase [Xinfangfangia sp. CPCC 101601]
MPHLTIEYSANLETVGDLPMLCLALRAALLSTTFFEEGAIRIRAIPCPHYAVADLAPENGFASLLLRIGAGRSLDDKKRIGAAVMAAAEQHFATQLARPHFALSLDILENDPQLSWKTNAIHSRLRAKKA